MDHIQTGPPNHGNKWNLKNKLCWINILNIANLFQHYGLKNKLLPPMVFDSQSLT